MARKSKEQREEEINNTPSPDESNETVGKRTRRKASGPSKAELRERLEELEKGQETHFTADQLSLISQGIFTALEGLTALPFTQVDEKIRNGWNEAGAECINVYVGTALGKWAPLIQLGSLSALIVQQAINIKAKEKKKLEAKVEKRSERGPDHKTDDVDLTLIETGGL